MSTSRRDVLFGGALAAAAALVPAASEAAADAGTPAQHAGPAIAPADFASAEKLMQVQLTDAERKMAAASWPEAFAPLMERRTGPRRIKLDDTVLPASRWDPRFVDTRPGPQRDQVRRSHLPSAPLPKDDADIAFAPLTQLAQWIEHKQLTSERLTQLYLARLRKHDPQLKCVITLTEELALTQARQADADLRAGHYHGPLHGIPYGAKDLLDTAGIVTTYGAEPFRTRVPKQDAEVIRRLQRAGAVLVAKLSLGALALNDVWFGGQTRNPWCPEEGSSGSSAGPGAATAAGLVGFSIGSETGGSIVSPSARCGVTGLRPTFGRVPRGGALTLSWTLDKLGPMTRGVEDALLVLDAIRGPDAGDPYCVPSHLSFDATSPLRKLRVGYFPAWMKDGTEVERAAMKKLTSLGLELVPVTLPDWPYDTLLNILFAETAASFEDLVLEHGIDQLKMQSPDAWPNTLRMARFLSAVDLVQADRFRRKVAEQMARVMGEVDLLVVPSTVDEMVTISNATGHPSLTLRTGFLEISRARSNWAADDAHPIELKPPRRVPYGVTLIGRLFDEGLLCRVGMELERVSGVASERPPGF